MVDVSVGAIEVVCAELVEGRKVERVGLTRWRTEDLTKRCILMGVIGVVCCNFGC